MTSSPEPPHSIERSPPRRRTRGLRVLRVFIALSLALSILTFATSLRWTAGAALPDGRCMVMVGAGAARIELNPPNPRYTPPRWPRRSRPFGLHVFATPSRAAIIWGFATSAGGGSRDCSIPLWAPIVLLAASLAVLWRVKVGIEGACTHCGYDLRGLTAGQPCPECGASTTSRS